MVEYFENLNKHGKLQKYLPIKPSKFDPELEFIFIDDTSYLKSFDTTYNFLKKMKKTFNIPCDPKIKIIDDGMIIGITIETNQFVPIIPEIYNADNETTSSSVTFNF